MKRTRWLSLVMITVFLAGCTLPMRQQQPTAFAFPTPNMTLTALFQPPVVIPPTVTQAAPQPTATQPPLPTNTNAPVVEPTTAPPTQPPATQPPAATATTAAPTRTPTPTDRRGGPASVAPYLATAPKIDGDWSDWGTTKAYPAAEVVYGAGQWRDDADLEASYKVAWDQTNLYIAVKVRDDAFVQTTSGENIFKGDSIELLIDTNVAGDFATDSLSGDDYQIGITPGKNTVGQGLEAYLWYPNSKAGSLTNVTMAAVSSAGVWRVEAAIPWSVFGFTPANNMHLGFALSVSDNDLSGQAVQQTMVSSAPDRVLTDPTTWADLQLAR